MTKTQKQQENIKLDVKEVQFFKIKQELRIQRLPLVKETNLEHKIWTYKIQKENTMNTKTKE